MGWLDRIILGAPWPASRIADLSIDIVRLDVCGLGQGELRQSIESRLGPPASYLRRRRGVLSYDQLGLSVNVNESGRLSGFFVQVREAAPPVSPPEVRISSPMKDYTGRWEPALGPSAPSREQIVSLLGLPTAQNTDEEELMLEWHRGTTFIGADFDIQQGYLTNFFVDFAS